MERVAVVIGLDGVGVDALEALRGYMPSLYSLYAKSRVRGWSEVGIPYTMPSWVSISTGVWPSKHGVWDSLAPRPSAPPRVVTRFDVAYPTMAEVAAAAGHPGLVVGVPLAYPPVIGRGRLVAVADWLHPRLEAWPRELTSRVVELMRGEGPPRPGATLAEWAESVARRVEGRLRVLEYLVERFDWRLAYIVFPETDWLFHRLYAEILEGRAPREAYEALKLIDKAARLVLDHAGSDSLAVLASDHGFMVARRALNLARILEELGLLRAASTKLDWRSRLFLAAARLAPAWLKHRLKYRVMPLAERLGVRGFDSATQPVDYERSRAYMTVAYYVYVNRSLSAAERRGIVERIRGALSEYSDMLEAVFEPRERFPVGDRYGDAPDLVVLPRRGFTVTSKLMYRRVTEEGVWYVHANEGMLAFTAANGEPSRLRSVDVAPTVLAWLGVPLDPSLDGAPLVEPPRGSRRWSLEYRVKLRALAAARRVARGSAETSIHTS